MSHAQSLGPRGIFVGALLGVAVALGACSPSEDPEPAAATPPTPATAAALTDRLLTAMGGRAALEGIQSLVMRGSGTRTRMGQIAVTGGEDGTGQLNGVTVTIDLQNQRAAFDYDVVNGDFTQHRTEVYTTHEGTRVGWNTGPNRPSVVTSPNGIFSWAIQNSPEMALRRSIVSIALETAATAAAEPAEQRTFGGKQSLYAPATMPSGEVLGLFFDPTTGLLNGFTALDTETMLGDVPAEYLFADYRPVAGVTLPHSVTIRKQNRPYASIRYDSITVNDASALAIFDIPADALEQAKQVVAAPGPWAPLAWNEVAPGIHHAVGYSHHSMVVEFPTFVAVVEAPYTDAQSASLVRHIADTIGKPIRYVIPSHPHYDHTGGLREVIAAGATAVLAAGHEGELRAIIEAPHTNPPDELARRREAGGAVGGIEVFSGMHAIEEGDRRIELYEVTSIPHVNPMVLAYVPGAGVLFQSDLFFGGPSLDAVPLYEAIRERSLEVTQIVGGHGGVVPFATLESVASATPAQ